MTIASANPGYFIGKEIRDGLGVAVVLKHRYLKIIDKPYAPPDKAGVYVSTGFIHWGEESVYLCRSSDGLEQWWPAAMVEAGGTTMEEKKMLTNPFVKPVVPDSEQTVTLPSEVSGNVDPSQFNPYSAYYPFL